MSAPRMIIGNFELDYNDGEVRYSEDFAPNTRCVPLPVLGYRVPPGSAAAASCRWVQESCLQLDDASACDQFRAKLKAAKSDALHASGTQAPYRKSEAERLERIVDEVTPVVADVDAVVEAVVGVDVPRPVRRADGRVEPRGGQVRPDRRRRIVDPLAGVRLDLRMRGEMRGGEMASLREVPFGLYYGSVDATPLFVMLAGLYTEQQRVSEAEPLLLRGFQVRSQFELEGRVATLM